MVEQKRPQAIEAATAPIARPGRFYPEPFASRWRDASGGRSAISSN